MLPLAFMGNNFVSCSRILSMAEAPVIATLVVGLASIITPELLRCYVAPRGLANNCPVHNGNNHNMGTVGRGVYDGSAKRSC